MNFLYKVISTWFGFGYSKIMPGTAGSIASLPIIFLIAVSSNITSIIVIFFMTIIAIFSINNYLYCTNEQDPKEVVIDEVIGQTITFTISNYLITNNKTTYNNFLILGNFSIYHAKLFIIGFLFFRFFDIIKVWPINIVDKHVKGALGIILDDVLAALAASFFTVLLYKSLHLYNLNMF